VQLAGRTDQRPGDAGGLAWQPARHLAAECCGIGGEGAYGELLELARPPYVICAGIAVPQRGDGEVELAREGGGVVSRGNLWQTGDGVIRATLGLARSRPVGS
jgi:hypothetical protein